MIAMSSSRPTVSTRPGLAKREKNWRANTQVLREYKRKGGDVSCISLSDRAPTRLFYFIKGLRKRSPKYGGWNRLSEEKKQELRDLGFDHDLRSTVRGSTPEGWEDNYNKLRELMDRFGGSLPQGWSQVRRKDRPAARKKYGHLYSAEDVSVLIWLQNQRVRVDKAMTNEQREKLVAVGLV